MAPEEHQANDFIPYPIDRVVGTLIDGTQARAAIEVLLQRGVDPAHIDLLYGESGLHRPSWRSARGTGHCRDEVTAGLHELASSASTVVVYSSPICRRKLTWS